MSNVITYNVNGNANVEEEKDVKFTLSLPSDLNAKVVAKGKKMGLSKLAYIRMILSQSVEE